MEKFQQRKQHITPPTTGNGNSTDESAAASSAAGAPSTYTGGVSPARADGGSSVNKRVTDVPEDLPEVTGVQRWLEEDGVAQPLDNLAEQYQQQTAAGHNYAQTNKVYYNKDGLITAPPSNTELRAQGATYIPEHTHSEKNRYLALALCALGGGIGAHGLYLGHYNQAIIRFLLGLVTLFFGFQIEWLQYLLVVVLVIDFVCILTRQWVWATDGEGRPLR